MSVKASLSSGINVVETLESGVPQADNPTITHNGLSESPSLDAASTPAVSLVAAFSLAMTAGAATIDLTSLVGTLNTTVNGTGKKVRAVKFRNQSTNTSAITIAQGGSNAYGLAGATFSVTLAVGQSVLFYLLDGAPSIAGGAKNIAVSGTGTEVLECIFVLG